MVKDLGSRKPINPVEITWALDFQVGVNPTAALAQLRGYRAYVHALAPERDEHLLALLEHREDRFLNVFLELGNCHPRSLSLFEALEELGAIQLRLHLVRELDGWL